MEVFAVLVKDLELLAEVIEHPREYTMAISGDEFDASLAAELVNSIQCCTVLICHDHKIKFV